MERDETRGDGMNSDLDLPAYVMLMDAYVGGDCC